MLGVRVQYREFRKVTIKCKNAIQEDKKFYENMMYDDFVFKLYDDGYFNMNLLGCPEDYDDDQAKQWLKDYIKRLVEEDK